LKTYWLIEITYLNVPLPAPARLDVIDDCNKTGLTAELVSGFPQIRTFGDVGSGEHGIQWLHLLSLKVKVVGTSYFFTSL